MLFIQKELGYNSTFAIGGVSYSAKIFIIEESLTPHQHWSVKPALRKAAKRQTV